MEIMARRIRRPSGTRRTSRSFPGAGSARLFSVAPRGGIHSSYKRWQNQLGSADFCDSKAPSPLLSGLQARQRAALDMMEYSASLNGESRSGSKRNERPRSVGNTGMG